MIVSHASLEPRRAASRFDAADESRRGKRVQSLVYGLKGDMADAMAHPRCDRLDAEVVTSPDDLKQGNASSCHPKAGTAQFLGGARSLGRAHGANLPR